MGSFFDACYVTSHTVVLVIAVAHTRNVVYSILDDGSCFHESMRRSLVDSSRYSVTIETRDLASATSSIAFVKTSAAHGTLDAERPLSEQLSVCQVSPKLFDSMLFTIRSCFVPFSRELGQTSENNDARYSGGCCWRLSQCHVV